MNIQIALMMTKKNTQINIKAYKDKHTVNVNIAMTIKVNMNKNINMSIFFPRCLLLELEKKT